MQTMAPLFARVKYIAVFIHELVKVRKGLVHPLHSRDLGGTDAVSFHARKTQRGTSNELYPGKLLPKQSPKKNALHSPYQQRILCVSGPIAGSACDVWGHNVRRQHVKSLFSTRVTKP